MFQIRDMNIIPVDLDPLFDYIYQTLQSRQRTSFGSCPDEMLKLFVRRVLEPYCIIHDISEERHAGLSRLMEATIAWINHLPNLESNKIWSQTEFEAVLIGLAPSEHPLYQTFFMEFYEEYCNLTEVARKFFDQETFQGIIQVSKIDWIGIWTSLNLSFKLWLIQNEFIQEE